MDLKNYRRTKYACYFTYLAMSLAFSLPPLLLATFQQMYDISYTLLGTLVLVNFFTQLSIDLIFSFFSKYFNVHKALRAMPLLTAIGLCIYALCPLLFPQYAYAGLLAGTIIFSVAAGLGEVLVSPTVAALPSENPEADMSVLHSLYGYGFVGAVVVSTLFLQFIGRQYWMYLILFWTILPIIAFFLLMRCQLPNMQLEQHSQNTQNSRHRIKSLALCVGCIFFGSCAESTMSNWISTYAEKALQMPKIWGDLLGMAVFAILLALTRTFYAKYGKNIHKTMLISMVGAAACYAIVAISNNAIFSLVLCALTGIFTSMLWPGTLILMEEKIPAVGVAAYALMGAGGDFGGSFAPQTLGIVVDRVTASDWAKNMAATVSQSPEQIGFRVGMLSAAVFPFLGALLLIYMKKHFKKQG